MKYIYFGCGPEDPQHNAILFVGEHDMVLGYAQTIQLPPLEELSSGKKFELGTSKIVLDTTSLPSGIDEMLSDIGSYTFTVVVKFGDRAELRLKNCSILQSDMPQIHTDSPYIEFGETKILVPRGER